jgi:hypothetical protein
MIPLQSLLLSLTSPSTPMMILKLSYRMLCASFSKKNKLPKSRQRLYEKSVNAQKEQDFSLIAF